ncbi:hypothetical protein HY572_05455 [Candidatus Micrarchaeota archaeon]|nr:hypothetical protein [Candidatus Micrarchaeota archaeon]
MAKLTKILIGLLFWLIILASYLFICYLTTKFELNVLSLLSLGATWATFGAVFIAGGTLLQKQAESRWKTNLNALSEISKQPVWTRWPFLKNHETVPLYAGHKIVTKISYPKQRFIFSRKEELTVEIPSTNYDLEELPIMSKYLEMSSKKERYFRTLKSKEDIIDFLKYSCLQDLLKYASIDRIATVFVTFGIALSLGAIISVFSLIAI